MAQSYLKYMPEPLLEDIVMSRCIPVIGAGFSKNASLPAGQNMPLWDKLGKDIANSIGDYEYSNPIDAISAFTDKFGKVKLAEYFSKYLHINDAKPDSAHLSFANLYFNIILTTNFDFLLEKSYQQTNINYRVIIDENQLSLDIPINEKMILKIHGDVNNPGRLIVTKVDYDIFIDNYPLLSTYVSNLLISRTPLFIGYSLDDPDFRQLLQIIRNRLGKLVRPAYIILVSPGNLDISIYERMGVKVIDIPGNKDDYGIILSALFLEIKEYWDHEQSRTSIIVGDKPESALSLPPDVQTWLCFIAIPLKLQTYYKSYIYPSIERFGFIPTTAMDILSPGENFYAKVSTLIDRGQLLIAEASTSATTYEISVADQKMKSESKYRKIIVIREKGQAIPGYLTYAKVFERPIFPEIPDNNFIASLEEYLKEISDEIGEKIYNETKRLLEKKENRVAVISAFVLLESELKKIIITKVFEKDKETRFYRLFDIMEVAMKNELINTQEDAQIKEWMTIRNHLIHTKIEISNKEAENIVKGIISILENAKARVK